MRHLVLAALALAVTPSLAFAQGAVPAPPLPAAPASTLPAALPPAPASPPAVATSGVPCTCAPPPAPAAQASPPVRRRRVVRYVPPPSTSPTTLPPIYNYAVAPVPFTPVAPSSGGILGYIPPPNHESIAYLGLGYTDGFIGAEGGSGGSGQLHAGY